MSWAGFCNIYWTNKQLYTKGSLQHLSNSKGTLDMPFFEVSEWVSDSFLTPIQQFFQLHVYHGENKLIFNEMMMTSALF